MKFILKIDLSLRLHSYQKKLDISNILFAVFPDLSDTISLSAGLLTWCRFHYIRFPVNVEPIVLVHQQMWSLQKGFKFPSCLGPLGCFSHCLNHILERC